ncbi:uncharacterized protein BJX67DRAFT_381047 [Aspergillus lucknowensis]|uniref:Uncharacterized protein n=1 Tax=Aspergillus lucknowensis TaxID=176173 RepID=A0ABR4LS12_9EURO
MTTQHRFKCSSGSLTTADYLEIAVIKDELPDDPQTLDDYGFSRCRSWNQKSHLLGLYKGLLINLEVEVKAIDHWRREGTLVSNIIREFKRVPDKSRGAYFPWFLKHTHLVDNKMPVQENQEHLVVLEWIEKAKAYLSPEDRVRDIKDIQPVARRDIFIAFAALLHSALPHPGWVSDGLDMWYSLGFCVCRSEREENQLGGLYNKLIGGNKYFVDYHRSLGSEYHGPPPTPTCSFEEFWTAYSSGRMAQLMDKYGLKEDRSAFKHLDTFLSVPPTSPRPSVWRLQHLLAVQDINKGTHPKLCQAARDYGVSDSTDARRKISLTGLYRQVLQRDPMELHHARVRGEALSYATSVVQTVDPGVASILQSLPTQ